MKICTFALGMALFLLGLTVGANTADCKRVMIAGTASHGPGDHEFNAGCLLLVPANGVPSTVTEEELKQNLDPKGGK